MKEKLKRPYLVTGLVSGFILLVLFLGKGIFPFGENTLIYGDMHDQITAFYYHFYDCFYANGSLLIDFSTSGGINFFGILSYYILSPFTFLFLLFKRENLYLAVSIVIALKMITASLTCMYSIRVLLKDKCPFLLAVILSISYAFSGYSLILYQITPWIDAMYLFPLIVVGLKKVLDLEKPYLYILSLTASIVCSFYVSYMSLILIFFLALIYIYVYKKKKDFRKSITALGISSILAVGLSMFITLPTVYQISESSRLNFSLVDIFNSKLGPITDKVSYFLPTSFLLVGVSLLLLNWKDHKKFLKWFVPSLLILGIGYIIEPVNKILHFFSYAFFPNRYGYMLFYLLVIGVAYYFGNMKDQKEIRRGNFIAISMTLLSCVALVILTILHYTRFQEAVFKLTISKDKYLIFILLFMCIATMIGIVSVIFSKRSRKAYPYIFVLTVVQILCNLYLYVGLTSYQTVLKRPYQVMDEISSLWQKDDYYRLKVNASSLITNNGMVTRYHNLDHFTSLVNGNNLETLKALGYSSHWTKTYSKNGTLFTDSLLANQYYLSIRDSLKEWYRPIRKIDQYTLYRMNEDLSYGYFTRDVKFDNARHVFDFQNRLYRAITNRGEDILTVYDQYSIQNLKVEEKKGKKIYRIQDEDATNYLEFKVPVDKKSIVYLEIFNSFANTDDDMLYKHMKIYVNNQLYKGEYPLPTNNGCLQIGTFEDEVVSIKIEFIYDTELSYIEVGILDAEKLKSFIREEKVDSEIRFDRNKIFLNVDSKKEGLFFVPIAYNDGYQAFVNGEKVELKDVYGNFLGVELKQGENKVEFVYCPPFLKTGIGIAIGTLLLSIFLFRFGWYQKLIECSWFSRILEVCYLGIYGVGLLMIYLIPILCFFLSYIFYIC